jgi:hypothetical protein
MLPCFSDRVLAAPSAPRSAYNPSMTRRLRVPVLLLVLAAGLSGCVDAEETWSFDETGGGTYELRVAWDADLWRRVGDVLGARVLERLSARPFPLRKSAWADGLQGLAGVEVLALEERVSDGGLREIAAKVRFKRLADLLRWEVLARRSVQVTQVQSDPKKPALCRFYMEPLAQVPVLDTLAALVEAHERPPLKAEGAAATRDPGPLERFGLDEDAARLVWRMVKLPLAKVRLRSRVEVLGEIEEERGQPSRKGGRAYERSWDFAALRKADADRTLRVAWRLRTLDIAPLAAQVGDRDPRPHGPTGNR